MAGGTLVVLDGDVGGMAAARREQERLRSDDPFGRRRQKLWAMVRRGDDARDRAGSAQADRLGLELVTVQPADRCWAPAQRSSGWPGLEALTADIEAASLAMRIGATKLILPGHAGTSDAHDRLDTSRLALLRDKALLLAQLVAVCALGQRTIDADDDAPASAPALLEIECPFAALTDAQLLDLALDLDAPLDTAWWSAADNDPNAEAWRARWSRCGMGIAAG